MDREGGVVWPKTNMSGREVNDQLKFARRGLREQRGNETNLRLNEEG